MKWAIGLILIIALLLVILPQPEELTEINVPVSYYYCTVENEYGTQSDVITAEIRDAGKYADDYQYLIEQYLLGPQTYDCISPFPAGTTLQDLFITAGTVQVVLSPHMATIVGSELMVACICLAKTVFELTGCSEIQISVENRLLNNQESITLTTGSFAYLDGKQGISQITEHQNIPLVSVGTHSVSLLNKGTASVDLLGQSIHRCTSY